MKSFYQRFTTVALLLISPFLSAQQSIGGFNVYFGSLHNHSNVSDGTGTPDEAYNFAKNTAHLDFFGLSDHSDGSGSIDASEWTAMQAAANTYNEPGVFTTFRGFEWTSSTYGHITVVNSENYCTSAAPTNTFTGVCDWLNNQECIAFFNHPGYTNSSGIEFNHFSTTPFSKFVGIELWTLNKDFSVYYYNDGYYSNDGNKGYYDEALMRHWRIGAMGSEDNHFGTWGTFNNHRMAILANANTREDLYNALKARRFYSTLDKNLALSFKINGEEMGSTILPGTYGMHILAADGDGEIFTLVELLKNGTVINTWMPNLAATDIALNLSFSNYDYYYIRVKQADGDEAISSPIWISDGNQFPVVSITDPASGAIFAPLASITINATATDTDGTITIVEFYNGSTLLGSDNSSPYSYNWANVAEGSYAITAKATDNGGASTTSAPVALTVGAPPVVTITSPVSGAVFTAPASVTLAASASDTDGTITRVDFYYGNTLLISDNTSPYLYTATNVRVGTYSITAKATDNSGNSTTSTPVEVVVVSSQPPVVSVTNPVSGAVFTVPASVTINASATDANGTITIVEFYNGGILLGSDNASPYSLTRTNVPIGTYSLTAKATDNDGNSTTSSSVTITVVGQNQPPAVSISSPVSAAVFTAPASVTIDASATDADGTVTIVEFYNGESLLGSDNTGPYSYTWTNVPIGTYSITAKTTDNNGNSTTSAPVIIIVVAPNQPPAVSISSPVSGAVFNAPASVTIAATATDTDGTVNKVEFYNGNTLLGSDNTIPYSFTWTNVAVGSYSISAKATDNTGASTTSAAVNITVNTAPGNYTFTKRIQSGSDDVEESASGSMLLNSDDIELVYDTNTTGDQIVGVRFNGVTIPNGATVTNASIQFTVDELDLGTCKLTIKGENTANAQPFLSTTKNVSNRTKTTATVSWNPSGWWIPGTTGSSQKTPDLKGIIQEIINSSSWNSGNSMVLIITGSGTRTAESYEGSSEKAALLTISYTIQSILSAPETFKSVNLINGIPKSPNVETAAKSENLFCYPVPFNNQLHIEFVPSDSERLIAIEIVNMAGKCELKQMHSNSSIVINLPFLKPGIYIVRVRTSLGLYNKLVIKN